jgi:leucyl-tRNA synthetase
VVGSDGDKSPITKAEQIQEAEGKMMNSDFLNGLDIHVATEKIMDYIEEKGWGKRVVSYHLRDWLISRQRYWGPPIPMIYCETCAKEGKSWFTTDEYRVSRSQYSGKKEILNTEYSILNTQVVGWYPVPEKDLPVLLPVVEDFKPVGTGKAPLANYPEFYETTCPHCGSNATRETDVSDTFLDSSWYFFRYLATDRNDIPFPTKNGNSSQRLQWLPVTSYIGGAEHAVLHLLYSRFVTMVLKDRGYIDFEEPYTRFRANGLIIKDGAKMSKSKGNVINPDDYVKKYGADTLRTYLAFVGPFTQGGDFQDAGIDGIWRFLNRVWKLATSDKVTQADSISTDLQNIIHKSIKSSTEDMEELRFNTVIAKAMTLYNEFSTKEKISKADIAVLLKLLAPFAPHMTEELWQRMHAKASDTFDTSHTFGSIHTQPWPAYEEKYLVDTIVTIAVQVNGKLRASFEIPAADMADQKKIEQLAKAQKTVIPQLEGKQVKKVIYVPGKILNFVV